MGGPIGRRAAGAGLISGARGHARSRGGVAGAVARDRAVRKSFSLSLNDAHCGALYVGQGDTIAVSSICMDRPIRCSVAEGNVSKASGNATVATLKCAPRQPPRPAPIEMSAALNDAVAVYVPGTCNNFCCIPRAIRKLVFFSF